MPPPNALFAEMLRAARELLAIRSPLDAELMVSASASIEVACCSRAVRSAAADSCSVSRPRISSASRWPVTSVLAPTHSMILPSRSIGTARTS